MGKRKKQINRRRQALKYLDISVAAFNEWRQRFPTIYIELGGADFSGRALEGVNFRSVRLKSAQFVQAPEYEEGGEFHEGLAAVRVNGKWGYVDTGGSWVIPPTLSHAEEFRRGLARVAWEDGGYGYINKGGETIWKNVPRKVDTGKSYIKRNAQSNNGMQRTRISAAFLR